MHSLSLLLYSTSFCLTLIQIDINRFISLTLILFFCVFCFRLVVWSFSIHGRARNYSKTTEREQLDLPSRRSRLASSSVNILNVFGWVNSVDVAVSQRAPLSTICCTTPSVVQTSYSVWWVEKKERARARTEQIEQSETGASTEQKASSPIESRIDTSLHSTLSSAERSSGWLPLFRKNSSMTTYLCIKCKSRSNRGSTRGIKDRETFAQGEAMRKGVTSDARCVPPLAKRKALKQIKYRKERRQRQSGKWRKLTGERRERGRDLRRASRFIIKKRDECAECRIIH